MKLTVKLLAATVALTAASSQARDAVDPGDRDARWTLGGGVVHYNNLYEGESNDASLFPVVNYRGDKFFVKHGSANYSIAEMNGFSAGVSLQLDGGFLSDKDEYKDNAVLRGLNERDGTIEGGFYVYHTSDLGRASLNVYTDVGGEHHGESASLSYIFDLQYGDFYINPVVGVEWIGEDKLNHYYGVSAAEANAQRAAYQTGSALNPYAALRVRYEIDDNWDVQVSGGVKRLDSSIRDSSIVNADYSYHSAVAVTYSF
jgi:outer membrane protein